jgi:Tol biopolymer transport system component
VSISPEAGAIDSISNLRGTPQISPDGSAVVYSSSPQAQMVPTAGMHFRRLNSLDIHTTKTTGIRNLRFWAPDSKTFVFADSNSLRKIRLPDGAAETVANGRVAKRKGWTLSGHDIRPEGFRDRNRRPTGVDSNSPPYTR